MSVETFKIVALAAIFFTGLGGGLLSRFLAAGVIHMLPDARAGFEALLGDPAYPWFALVCAVGFLFILFLEKVCFPHDHKDGLPATAVPGNRALYPYLLLLILSIHSIITGVALGTESRIMQAAVIMIAVLAHKGTAAFALGVSMLRTSVPPSALTAWSFYFPA